MKKPSAVVDTNIFISSLITSNSPPSKLISALKENRFELVTSELLLEELETVLTKPKYTRKFFITQNTKRQVITLIRSRSRQSTKAIKPNIPIRDLKDLIFLTTAINAKSNYLVSCDKDLLILKNHPNIKPLQIVTVREFFDQIL